MSRNLKFGPGGHRLLLLALVVLGFVVGSAALAVAQEPEGEGPPPDERSERARELEHRAEVIERKLEQFRKDAERLSEQGKDEEAEEQAILADALEQALDRIREERQDAEREATFMRSLPKEVRDRLENARRHLEEALDAGDEEKADKLQARLEELEQDINKRWEQFARKHQGEWERQQRAGALDELRGAIKEMEEALDAAREDGNEEDIRELEAALQQLREEVGNLEREGGERGEHGGEQPRGGAEEMDKVRERLRQLEREIADAKQAGKEDAVEELTAEKNELLHYLDKLRKRAEQPHGDRERPGAERERREAQMKEIEDQLGVLEREIRAATEAGNEEVVKELTAEALALAERLDHLRQASREQPDRPDREGEIAMAERRLDELEQEIHTARERGDEQAVKELLGAAHELQARLKELRAEPGERRPDDRGEHGERRDDPERRDGHAAQARRLKQRLGDLEHELRAARERGDRQAARQLRAEADELEAKLRRLAPNGERGERGERPRDDDSKAAQKLRREIKKLEGRVDDLFRQLEEAVAGGNNDRAEKLEGKLKGQLGQLQKLRAQLEKASGR